MTHIHLACNDYRNGGHQGFVESIGIFGNDNIDPMLMLTGNRRRDGSIVYTLRG